MITSKITNFSSMSAVKAKVEIYKDFTLVKTCTCSDVLEGFKITREGENSKFFGFGVCQKLNIDFIDLDRELELTPNHYMEVTLGDGVKFDYPYPSFHIAEIKRDEKTSNISCVAYDALYQAGIHTVSELGLEAPYSIQQVAERCTVFLGLEELTIVGIEDTENNFDLNYPEGANLDGSESIRDLLNALAEATQTIYYINSYNELVFKRLDKDADALLDITKDEYYELAVKPAQVLVGVCSATELGDNLISSLDEDGVTQYVRDNPFWDLRPDRALLVNDALDAMLRMEIAPFKCDWNGDYRLEVGDKLAFITDDSTVISYLLSDWIEYDGTFTEISSWEYIDNSAETPTNPTTIGEKINQTFARVDKVNKDIQLVVSSTEEQASQLAQLQVNIDGISARVSDEHENITKQLNTKISSEELSVSVQTIIDENGVSTVKNTIGTFDEEGLTIEETGGKTKTQLTKDGMAVYNTNTTEALLTANSEGVDAMNLKASTYLIIGGNSRFEDWQGQYTACFWIGG